MAAPHAQVYLGAFCGAPLSRTACAEHKDPKWEEAALGDPDSRFLVFSAQKGSTGAAPLLAKQRPLPPAVAWQKCSVFDALGIKLPGHSCHGVPPLLLGSRDGMQHFAVLVDRSEQELSSACDAPEGKSLFVSDGMMKLMMIGCEEGDYTIIGSAFSKITWHKTAQYCGTCGQPTAPSECGMKRVCTACPVRCYPRMDPVCIALVRNGPGDACLLVHNKGWPAGMWTCISGFVEQGEQVEEAIRREVSEEAGVEVDISGGLDWLGTQPWALGPGGKSELMLAAEVTGCSGEIKVGRSEVEDAQWFGREAVAGMLAAAWNMEGRPFVPGKTSAAHHLLRRWLERGTARGPAARASSACGT